MIPGNMGALAGCILILVFSMGFYAGMMYITIMG